MKLNDYLDFDVLFLTMCFLIAIRYYTNEDPKFIIKYR